MCWRREGVHYLHSVFTLYCIVVSQSMYVQYVIDICQSCKLQRWNIEDDEVREILGQEAESVDGEAS